MKRTSGGADSVSVANIPPCSWTPKPLSGSPVRTTSLVSTWTTCPPGPTELEAKDTGRAQTQRYHRLREGARAALWAGPGLRELLWSFFFWRRLRSEFLGLMGTAGLGRVLEVWLLGPEVVVVEPGEKLAETRAVEAHDGA